MTAGTLSQPPLLDRLLGSFGLARKAAPSGGQLYPAMPQSGQAIATYPRSWQGWADTTPRDINAPLSDLDRAKTSVTSAWVFSDIEAIAAEFSAAELIVKERGTDEDGLTAWEDTDEHPLEELWSAPNPFMSQAFLAQYWVWMWYLTGECYLFFAPDGDGLKEIWPVPSWMIEPVPDPKLFIKGYLFKPDPTDKRTWLTIDSQYICYSRHPHPFDVRRGLSPLVAAFPAIQNDLAMLRWNRDAFAKNNLIPSGVAILPEHLNEPDYQRARQELLDFYGGGQRRTAIIRSGAFDYKTLGLDPEKMQFNALRDKSREEIDRAMGFPAGYWSESSNRANSNSAKATVIETVVWPRLVMLAQDIKAQIVNYHYGPDYRVEFDDIRPRDRALELQELTTYQSFLTINELRKRIDAKPLEDVRGAMFVIELNKGTPTPGSEPAQQVDDLLSSQEAELGIDPNAPPDTAALPPEEPAALTGDTGNLDEQATASASANETTKALRLWEKKARARLKDGRRPLCDFVSDAIPDGQRQAIKAALRAAGSDEQVRAAFKASARPRAHTLLADDDILKRARALAEEVER